MRGRDAAATDQAKFEIKSEHKRNSLACASGYATEKVLGMPEHIMTHSNNRYQSTQNSASKYSEQSLHESPNKSNQSN